MKRITGALLCLLTAALSGCGETGAVSSDAGKSGNGYEDVLSAYNEAVDSGDADDYLSVIYPEKILDEIRSSDRYDELVELAGDKLGLVRDNLEAGYGENAVTKFADISSVKQLDASETAAALNYFSSLAEEYGVRAENIKIEDGVVFEWTQLCEGDAGSEEKKRTACAVRVEDDGWKFISISADDLKDIYG